MGSVLKRNYLMFKLGADALYAQTPQTAHDIVGPLCTTIDRLGSDVKLPEMHIGDVIAVRSCGAYGLTASPIHFISHEAPKEILVGSQESGVPVLHDISEIGDRAYSPA
jgi:diaminopimelate decarboxylase